MSTPLGSTPYSPGEKKNQCIVLATFSCFSEDLKFWWNYSFYTGLHILLYSWLCPFFSKQIFLKSNNVLLCCRDDTQENHCGYFFSSDLPTKPVMELSTAPHRILWVPACHLSCIWGEKTWTRKLHEEGMETSGSLANCHVLKYLHLVHCRQAVSSKPANIWQGRSAFTVLAALEVTGDWVQYCPVLWLVVVWDW